MLKKGDKIKVKSGKEHESEQKGATGTVKIVSTPALGILFDEMGDDEMAGVHKWYVESELEKTSGAASESNMRQFTDDILLLANSYDIDVKMRQKYKSCGKLDYVSVEIGVKEI